MSLSELYDRLDTLLSAEHTKRSNLTLQMAARGMMADVRNALRTQQEDAGEMAKLLCRTPRLSLVLLSPPTHEE